MKNLNISIAWYMHTRVAHMKFECQKWYTCSFEWEQTMTAERWWHTAFSFLTCFSVELYGSYTHRMFEESAILRLSEIRTSDMMLPWRISNYVEIWFIVPIWMTNRCIITHMFSDHTSHIAIYVCWQYMLWIVCEWLENIKSDSLLYILTFENVQNSPTQCSTKFNSKQMSSM